MISLSIKRLAILSTYCCFAASGAWGLPATGIRVEVAPAVPIDFTAALNQEATDDLPTYSLLLLGGGSCEPKVESRASTTTVEEDKGSSMVTAAEIEDLYLSSTSFGQAYEHIKPEYYLGDVIIPPNPEDLGITGECTVQVAFETVDKDGISEERPAVKNGFYSRAWTKCAPIVGGN